MPSTGKGPMEKFPSWPEPGRGQTKEKWVQLLADNFTRYAAVEFPKLPRQGRFEKEVNEDPVVEAITADLKDGGFTLENLRWL